MTPDGARSSGAVCCALIGCQAAGLTVQVQQHVGLEQVFGSCHLGLGHRRAQGHPEGQRRRQHLSGYHGNQGWSPVPHGGLQIIIDGFSPSNNH